MREWENEIAKEKATAPPINNYNNNKKDENFVVRQDCKHEIKLKIERSLFVHVYCVLYEGV